MAEFNQSFHLPSPFRYPDDEISLMFQNLGLNNGNEDIIAPPSAIRASPSSYSSYQNNYLQNTTPTINGGFPSLSWDTRGNAVDWSHYATSSKFVNNPYAYALPSVSSSWDNFPSPITRFNGSISAWNDFPKTEDKKKEALEVYNKMKIDEFKSYLKLKGWKEEQIQWLKQCNDPRLLLECYGLDIHMMCMNQLGSMYLQRVIQTAEADFVEIILDAVLKGIFEVTSDPNGAYVFQKILENCNQEQLRNIVSALTRKDALIVFINVVMTESGTKCIQKLITKLKFFKPLMKDVIDSLKPYVVDLMTNQSGRKLIDHCMSVFKPDQSQFIYEAVVLNCLDLAIHKEGYHVVSKAIQTIQDPYRMLLLTLITNNAIHLAQDPNANFVVQKVIELENPRIITNLCTNISERVVQISMTKCGSHVIEKCLLFSTVVFVVKDILSSKKLMELAKNPFGNYVLQKALDNLKGKHHELYIELLGELRAISKSLENHRYGRLVLKYMGDLENLTPS